MQKFTQMRVQLQAVSLRMQTLRSNESMAQAMRGATRAMGQMNRSLNLPQIQRIMNEFEKESATMDMKEEMMSDAVDDAMEDEDEGEGEDVESDKILREVFDEIGMGMNEAVSCACGTNLIRTARFRAHRQPDGKRTPPVISSRCRRRRPRTVVGSSLRRWRRRKQGGGRPSAETRHAAPGLETLMQDIMRALDALAAASARGENSSQL